MSADCFPDQVRAPLASTLMTRSTVRWARTGSLFVRQGRWACSFSWVKAAHATICIKSRRMMPKEEFTGPYHSVK